MTDGHRAPADLELGLEDHAAGSALGTGHQLLDLGDQDDLLEQVVDPQVLQRRDLHRDGVATPRLGHQPVLGELLEHPVGVGLLPVDLVDGHDDRHVGGLGVVDGLDGLGHHPVVGRHHQHHDVGHLGSRARMAVNASWPGVSMKVIGCPATRPGRRRCAG